MMHIPYMRSMYTEQLWLRRLWQQVIDQGEVPRIPDMHGQSVESLQDL